MAAMAQTLRSPGVAFAVHFTPSYPISDLSQTDVANELLEQELLIERTIKNSEVYLTSHRLQVILRAKVPQNLVGSILNKLLHENKILYHKGKIIWTETDDLQEEAAKKHFIKLN